MFKQLTEIERNYIETSLNQGLAIKDIAQNLNRSISTITREIQRNRVFTPNNYDPNQCILKTDCRKRHACGNKACDQRCNLCHLCNKACPSFTRQTCKTRDRSPYSCNACPKRRRCRLDKYFYLSPKAQKSAEVRLSESRAVIQVTEEELAHLNHTVTNGLRKKQPLYHIIASSDLSVSQATLYRYLDKGYLDVRNIDLPKKVGWKIRTGRKAPSGGIPGYRINKTYMDYLAFIQANPEIEVVQMDLVEGSGSKNLLTFTFTRSRLLLAILIPDKTQQAIKRAFDDLEAAIGHRVFKKLFRLILTDNGPEFQNHKLLEFTAGGVRRAEIYYCDPYSSYQKGACEKNHTYIRMFLPKGSSFDWLSQNKVNTMLSNINSVYRASTNEDAPFSLLSPTLQRTVKKFGLVRIYPEDVVLGPSVFK